MQKLNNINIVRLFEFIETDDVEGGLYILVIEFCPDGNLQTDLEKQPENCYTQGKAIDVFKQIANGMCALHERQICHRE
jgi:serine/threonine protein kinase